MTPKERIDALLRPLSPVAVVLAIEYQHVFVKVQLQNVRSKLCMSPIAHTCDASQAMTRGPAQAH